MKNNLWAKLVTAYPTLGATVAGEAPLKFAVDEYAAGRCATVMTEKEAQDVSLS